MQLLKRFADFCYSSLDILIGQVQGNLLHCCSIIAPIPTFRASCRLDALVVARKVYLVASALMWIHGKGLVHQDLHPGNVLETLDGSAWRLSDFGSARRTKEPDGSPTCLTIPTYAYSVPRCLLSCSPG